MRHFFGGRAFSQTDKITCEYSLFVLHPEHSHCFFRWESACWWARSVTWEIYDLHPSQESIKEKITLTSSKVCLNTTYEGNHTYSSTTILTECVLNVRMPHHFLWKIIIDFLIHAFDLFLNDVINHHQTSLILSDMFPRGCRWKPMT